ncbi:hypothetical protein AJ80_02376 [Polytolypa hystricis UAMH7299]|uniref:Uncharacterized protein n=1 Tax=Polytolypa hystricis (strain UAMH7299) TaxID=1447883 RepID=A0A2B7YQK9_POLH7|nr:hypothetical protein AJ80_02376 [Polytolypa hystricis UAMH7299]
MDAASSRPDISTLLGAITRHAAAASATCLLLVILWTCFHAVYNIFFHPLKNFPGPTSWAATRFPWCWHQYHGRLPHRLLQLHKRYGHVVRVAPDELSFTTATAWKTIYGQRAVEMSKDPVFSLHTPTGAQSLLTADRETHARQRRLLAHAFSEKALREQEYILQSYVNKLLDQLSRNYTSGALDVAQWFNSTTFDLIGDLAFGEDFGCLDIGDLVPFGRDIRSMTKELIFDQMLKYYGLLSFTGLFLPKNIKGVRRQNIQRTIDTVERRIQGDTDRKDFLFYILAANDEKGMSREEIYVNSFSLSIAGSESSATSISGAVFYILTYHHVYEKLVDGIRSAFKSETEITLVRLNDLVYLTAVLTETLRLYPPVSITLPRVVPGNGEAIDSFYVPGGTTVGVNHFSASRHPENFHCPDEFLPERWLRESRNTSSIDKDEKAAMQPFSYGPRGCIGRNLAWAEMRLVIAKLLWRFDLELVGNNEDWLERQTVCGFWEKSPLRCKLTPVKRDS